MHDTRVHLNQGRCTSFYCSIHFQSEFKQVSFLLIIFAQWIEHARNIVGVSDYNKRLRLLGWEILLLYYYYGREGKKILRQGKEVNLNWSHDKKIIIGTGDGRKEEKPSTTWRQTQNTRHNTRLEMNERHTKMSFKTTRVSPCCWEAQL